MLTTDETRAYSLLENAWIQDGSNLEPKCIQDGSNLDTQDRIGKDRLGEDRDISLPSSDGKHAIVDYQQIVDLFNSVCCSLPRVKSITDARRKAIRNAGKQLMDAGGFQALFDKVERSDFLTGRSGNWQGCCFDWIMKPANITKIIEGNYDNRAGGSNRDYTDPDRYSDNGWGE